MDTLEVLMKARAEVEKGWCKHTLEDRSGNVCAIGALHRAAHGEVTPVLSDSITQSGYHVLLDVIPGGGWSIAAFNNAPETTKEDVLALFDRAIAAEAVKASPDPAHVHAVG